MYRKNMMSSLKPEVYYVTYRNDDKGGPSHGHGQHAQKLVKFSHVVFRVMIADKQIHRQRDILTIILCTPPSVLSVMQNTIFKTVSLSLTYVSYIKS